MSYLTIFLILRAIVYAGHYLSKQSQNNSRSSSAKSTPSSPISVSPPKPVITLVGAAGVGKSSTGNALLGYKAFEVGATHGSTSKVTEVQFQRNYLLRDTPGLMDEIDYQGPVFRAIEDAELVIFVASGQLYRPELESLKRIIGNQKYWNKQQKADHTKRQTILYINMEDRRNQRMPSKDREKVKTAIYAQTAHYLPAENIAFGTAAPILNGNTLQADLSALFPLISKLTKI